MKFAPSLMGADLMHVGSQIEKLNDKAFCYHVDIIDWHFAKNLCFSPDFVSQLRAITNVPLDIHLMIDGLEMDVIKLFSDAGADIISLHARDANRNIFKYADYIKGEGKKLGIVLDPAVPLSEMEYYLDEVDLITFLAVSPGFPNQKLIRPVLQKIKDSISLREEKGCHYLTQIDGGCSNATLKQVNETGVDIMIVGKTLLFGVDPDMDVAWKFMENNFNEYINK